MTDDQRDPRIQALFANAEKDLKSQPFVKNVNLNLKKLKRRTLITRISISLILASLAFLLQGTVIPLSQSLISPLFELKGLAGQMLAPINSFAGVLSAVLIGLRAAHKKIFAR